MRIQLDALRLGNACATILARIGRLQFTLRGAISAPPWVGDAHQTALRRPPALFATSELALLVENPEASAETPF